MNRNRLGLLILLCTLLLANLAMAAGSFEIPSDVQKLMPAEASAIIAVSSINELADRYVAIMNSVGDEEEATREDVLKLFDGTLEGFTDVVDLERPLFAAAGLPNLMGGGEPPFIFMVPLRDKNTKVEDLPFAQELPTTFREGRYLALVSDPTIAPADGVPALAAHLPAGVVSATLDLEGLVTSFRPFIEMGLAGIPVREEGAGPDAEGYTVAEAAAMREMIVAAMDAITRLDMSVGNDDEMITWHTGLGIKPGSALDVGPQPDFQRALALTAALPTEADFLQVIALDQTQVFKTFRDYYLITMKNALSGMGEEQAARYGAWVEDYLDSMDIWANPMAAALRLTDDGMSAHSIMETADAEAALDQLTSTLEGMNDLGIGYNLTRGKDQKVSGVKFRVWTIDIDLEQFEAAMPQGTNPAMSGTERMQAEQLVSILRRIMPTIYLGAGDGRLYMASDSDTRTLAEVVKRAGKKGHAVAEVADVAAKAGPGCQQVITGDLLAIIDWVTDILSEMEDAERIVIADNPIPFQADFVIDGADLGVDMAMDLTALGNLIKAGEALEELEMPEDGETAEEATGTGR